MHMSKAQIKENIKQKNKDTESQVKIRKQNTRAYKT